MYINTKVLCENIKQAKLNNLKSKICLMVKANAYGLGMDNVVSIIDEYVDCYGVACFFEAMGLAELTDKPILIVGPIDFDEMVNDRFVYSCANLDDIDFLIKQDKKIKIHLKINTGMNRYGLDNLSQLKIALKRLKQSKLQLVGVFTHFATCDEYTKVQNERFSKFIKLIKKQYPNVIVHADNSEANKNMNHDYDMVRLGHSVFIEDFGGEPSVRIETEVVDVHNVKTNELIGYDYRCVANKSMRVGVIPIGYFDGLMIKYIGKELIVGKYNCKILNVCMDCTMIDLTNSKIKKGDRISLIDKFNPLKSFAEFTKTIDYEVMCNFNSLRADIILTPISNSR